MTSVAADYRERISSWLRFVPERRLISDHVARWGDYEHGVRAGVVAANCQLSDHVNEICTSTSRRREIEGNPGARGKIDRELRSLATALVIAASTEIFVRQILYWMHC